MADKWWTNEAPAGTGEAWWSNTPADSMAGIGYEDVEAPVAPRDGSSPVIPREVAPTVPQDVAPSEPRGLGGLGMANVRPEPRPDDLLPPGNSVWTKPDGTGSVVYNPGEEAGPPASSRSRIDEAAERLASATGGLDSRDQQIADIEARLRRPDLSERERAFREQQLGDLLDGQARLAERSARVEASRTPGKFADETFGQTARRLGQQAAAGVTDIAAGIPEGLAIQSSAGQLGRVQSYGAGIEDRDQQIADVEARLAQPGISDQERAMREQQLVDLRAGQERLGALGQETLTPPQERGGYAFGQRVREFSKEQFGEPPAEDDTFVGMLARGFGSMVGFGVGTALTGVLGGAVAGSAVNRQQVYEEAKAAGATDEDAYAASSLAGLVGLTEVIPIERALRVLPKPLREEVGGKLFERFKRIAQAGGEEALQEAVQGTANNLIAQEYYDPERGTFEDVPQQALIGAILGSGMGAAGQAADAMLTPSDRAAAQPDDMIAEGKRATEEMIASLGKDAPSSVPKGAVDMGVLYPEPEAAPSPEPESLGGLGGAGTARVQPYITQQGSPLVEPAPAVSGPASARVQPYITDETAARPEVPVVPGTANLGGLGAMPRPSPVKDTQSVAPVQEANAEASQAPAPSPVEPVVASPVEAVEPQQGAVADDEVRLSGDALQAVETDAETFQYKSGGDKKGVTGKLAISKWDNDSAGKVLIYEYEDGRRVVVDGHQRMDAAQRLAREGQDVRLTAIVKREADGITPKEARIIGALQNLRQPGNTDQIDAAKVIREAPEAIDAAVSEGSLAPKNISRARELARLSDDGFKMVLNGVVSERDAAIVGRIVEDKAAHANILGLVSRIEPRNVVEAESIVRQAMNAQTTETQTSLFGDEDVAENVYAERAQILSRTMLALGKKRSTFKVLQDRADAIEGTGQNRLDAEANAAALDDATRYRQVLMTEANRKGPISDALTREARAVRAGEKKPAEAARAFETFLETGTGPDDGDAAAPQRADAEAVDVDEAAADAELLAPLGEGYGFKRGRGLNKDKWVVTRPNGKPVWNAEPTKKQAVLSARQRLKTEAKAEADRTARAERNQKIAETVRAGGEVTADDLSHLGLKPRARFDYISPVAQELFGVSKARVRKAMGDALSYGVSDMGVKVWYADTKKALKNVADFVDGKAQPADAGSDGLAAGQPVRDVPAGDVGGREAAGDGREPVDAAGEAGGGVLPDDGQDGGGSRVDDATLSRAVREGLVEKEFKGRGGKGRFRKAGIVLDVDEAAAKSVDPYATRDPSGTGFFVDLKAVEKRIGKDAIEALRYQDAKIGSAGRYAILQKIGQDRQGIPFSELSDDEQIAVMRSYRAPGRGEFSVYGTGADRKVSLTTRGVEELRNGPPRVDVPENSSAQQEQPATATDTQSPSDPRIFTDNGAAKGNRTRYFRDGPNGGVEWMYAADYAGGDRRWFGFGSRPGMSVEQLQADGMDLAPVQEGNSPAGTDTQSPPAGETETDPLRGAWETYDAANAEYQAAYEQFAPVQDAFRAGDVANADFIAARDTFNAAKDKVDAAQDAIAGTTDPRLPVEPEPEPAPETPDLFATEPTPAGDQTVIPGTREDQGRDRTRDQMEIEARQKQSKMRRLDQTRVEDDAGGLFGEEQKGLFKEQRPDPAKAEKRAATFTDLRNRLDKMGLKRVALERIDMNAQGAAEIDAAGNARILLGKSLDDVATLGHEALHILRGMNLFTPDEWNALAGRATAEWMQRYGIAKRYGDLDAEAQVEEAIAEAYGAWLSDRAKNPPPLIQRAFAKMKRFFRAVREALTGQGVTDVNDLFADIESGKVAAQEPQGEVTRKYQRQTQDERNAAVSEDVGEDVENAVTPETPVKARQESLVRAALRQPLDHAARIPFSLVGGLDSTNRWRPGKTAEAWVRKKLTEDRIANSDFANVPALEAPLGFLDTAAEAARYALIDRYGLPEDYIAADRQRSLKEAAIARELGDHMQAMAEAGVNAESARVLQAILNGEQIEDADMAKLAKPIREGIDALGQRAVEAGLISRESYERNKGSYLHRVYLRHEKERMEAGLTGRAERFAQGRRRKIIGDELRGRGMFVDVEWSKLYKTNPTFLKAGRGKPQVGDKIVILDLETPQGEGLDGIGAPTGKTRKRVFWPADEAIPPAYDNYTNRGTFEVRGEGKDKITLWRDYTKDERKKMGEILDARYTVARTYSLLMHDITTGEFFKEVAQNEQWARNDPPEGARTVEDATKRLRRHFVGRDADQEWVKVPTISVGKDSTAKRYGALSGMYVRADIWRDMVETEAMQTPAWWKSLNTVWKLNKTARNPVVHMNNVMSNAILMDMADVRPRELRMAIKEWRNKGDLYREAQDNGAFGADMVSQEVRRDVMEPLMREIVAQERADKGGWEAYITTLAGIDNALGRMSGKGLDRVGDAWNWFDGKMVQAYQFEDELFRLATYIRRREQGVEPEMAALEARDQFLNYDIKAPLVNAARATVLPFLAYTYRAVPVILRTLAERPWKIAKYATVMAGANALAYSLAPSDYDEEEERGSMQDAQSGKTWLGVPRMLRMPALLGGDPVFMDIRRWIPAGDVFDVAQGENILPAWLHIGGPLVVAMEAYFNRSLFTGEDIRNTMTDSVGEQMFDTANYLYQAFAPGAVWWPGSYHFQNVFFKSGGEAVTASGDPIRRSEAVAGAFGLKVRSRDVEQGYRNHVYAHEEKDRDLARQMAAVKRQASRNQITREQMDAQLAALQAKRRANMERLRERMDARQ